MVLRLETVELVEIVFGLHSEVPILAGSIKSSKGNQLFVVIQVALVVEENLSVKSGQTDEFLGTRQLANSYTLRLPPSSRINLKTLAVNCFCISKSI